MTRKIFLINAAEVGPGCVKRIEADQCELALFNLEGRFYATQNQCTHATASLAEGDIVDGDMISCPVHYGQFHIPTGEPMSFPCTVALRTYKVFEEAGKVYADLDAEADAVETLI